MGESLRVHLLGQLRLFLDGRSIALGSPRKSLPLLGYLLLHRSGPIARDHLAFTLWPDDDEEDARTKLRATLHLLSRSLPPPPDEQNSWIAADAQTVCWNPRAEVRVDVDDFERHCRTPGGASSGVDLYAGDLLEALYDDWVFVPREKYRSIYLSALSDLVVQSRSRRDFARAIGYAQRILTAEPWREDALRHLMAARYEAGDRAGALAEFQRFGAHVKRELGVDPMPETIALRSAILEQRSVAPALPAKDGEDVTPPGRPAALPFVGRRTEMDNLGAHWSRAARGKGGCILIGGEAGVGKSRLCDELALVAESQGGRVLRGATGSPEAAPYECIAASLRSALPLVAAADVGDVWLAALAELVPEVRNFRPDLPALPEADEPNRQARLFEALARAFTVIARPRPVIVILEDLHWATDATMAAAAFLARRIAAQPILMLATYREEEAAREHPLRSMRRALQRERLLTHVSLDRLRPDDLAALVALIPAVESRGADFAAEIYARSEGNALFVSELLHEVIDKSESPSLPEGTSNLKATILTRVGRLAPDTRAVLDVAAVAGPTFNVETIRDAIGWVEARVQASLDALIDHRVIREAAEQRRFDYAFAHHLIQSTVYAEIDAESRRRRHRRIGEVLEGSLGSQATDRAADLARHFEAGGELARAVAYYEIASVRAAAVYAYVEAATLASAALAHVTDPARRFALLMLREEARAKYGDVKGRKHDLDELARIEGELVGEQRRQLLARRLLYELAVGETAQALQTIETLKADAQAAGDTRMLALAWRASSTQHRLGGDEQAARTDGAKALRFAEQVGDSSLMVDCMCDEARIAIGAGDFQLASERLVRAAALAEKSGALRSLALIHVMTSRMLSRREHFAAGLSSALSALDLSRRLGDRAAETAALNMSGYLRVELRDFDNARNDLELSVRIADECGFRKLLPGPLGNLAVLEGRLGNMDRAVEIGHRARAVSEELNDRPEVVTANANLTEWYILAGDFQAAKKLALEALGEPGIDDLPMERSCLLGNLGTAECELGEYADAILHLDAAVARFDELNVVGLRLNYLVQKADALLRSGDARSAADCIDRYLAGASEEKMIDPRGHQYGYWVAAKVYRAMRMPKRARELLVQAAMRLDELASHFKDEEARARFLALSFNREIRSAADDPHWLDLAKARSATAG